MERLKNVVTYGVLIKVLCLLGFVYQCFDISMIYFSYKTSTNVKYESQTFVDIPGVTLCYDKLEQINDHIRTQLYQKFKTKDDWKIKYLNNMTIREQLNVFAIEPVKLQDCFLRWNIRADIKCNLTKNYTNSFDGLAYCVTVFNQHGDNEHNEQGDDKYRVRNSENNNKLMISFETKKLNRQVYSIDDILVKLHDRKELPNRAYTKGTLLINQHYNAFVYVKYQKTIVKYLFNPRLKPCLWDRQLMSALKIAESKNS